MPGEISADDTSVRPSVDGTTFRQAMRHLAAGVCVVTTIDHMGTMLGLTATSVTSVSLEPPLVLVCVDNRSRTIAPLKGGAPFVVHFLAHGQEELARRFATFLPDKLAGVDYQLTPGGCPRLAGVLSSVECVAQHIYAGGDHTIIVGRVVDCQAGAGETRPLMYFAGQYLQP